MQQFEYRYAEVGQGNVLQENGAPPDATKPLLHEYLSERGNEGWELVAIIGKPYDLWLFFKRPKPNGIG